MAVLVAALGLTNHSHLLAKSLYSISILPAVEGQTDVVATGINDHGQVVGYIQDGQGRSRGVAWSGPAPQLLPVLAAEFPFSQAFRINNAGQIVGKAAVSGQAAHAALWTVSSTGIEIRNLGTLPGGNSSFATDINESGVVVGSSEAAVGSSAFRWTASDGFTDYGNTDPPHRLATAGFNAINNQGLMVGTTYFLLDPYHAAMADPSGKTAVVDISPPGRNSLGMALGVNDAGTIVGYQSVPGSGPQAAIFHGDGTFTALGTLGLEESWAQDVNSAGIIVGRAFSFLEGGKLFPRAFAAYPSAEGGPGGGNPSDVVPEMVDLWDHLVNPNGWELLIEATAINDRGMIAGTGIYAGEVRAFVLSPVPEPTVPFGLVAVALAFLRHRANSRGRM